MNFLEITIAVSDDDDIACRAATMVATSIPAVVEKPRDASFHS